ncbi:hypothetical protein Tco_1064183 [Tanacetum coccineum]
MLAIDGVGFDWSDMAQEQVQTNMALMAFLDSEVDEFRVIQITKDDTIGEANLQNESYHQNEADNSDIRGQTFHRRRFR